MLFPLPFVVSFPRFLPPFLPCPFQVIPKAFWLFLIPFRPSFLLSFFIFLKFFFVPFRLIIPLFLFGLVLEVLLTFSPFPSIAQAIFLPSAAQVKPTFRLSFALFLLPSAIIPVIFTTLSFRALFSPFLHFISPLPTFLSPVSVLTLPTFVPASLLKMLPSFLPILVLYLLFTVVVLLLNLFFVPILLSLPSIPLTKPSDFRVVE